jgi:PAS domain S-box-containing protein
MAAKKQFKWFRTMGDRAKALIIVSTIILLLALAFLYYGVSQHNKTIDLLISRTEANILITIGEVRNRSLIDYEKRLQTFLQIQREIITAFAERDRERLYKLSLPKLNVLKRENGYFNKIHFYLPDGHSFLRVHDPETWGDDLIKTRPSLQNILKEKKPISGFEVGSHGGFFWAIAPVYYQERFVGAVEFGLDMHQAVDIVQGMLHMKVTSCFREEQWKAAANYDKFSMVRRDQFVINSHGDPIYSKLPSDLPMGAEYHTPVEIEGNSYIVHTHQVFNDFNGDDVGGLFILQDITEFIHDKQRFLWRTTLFTVFLLILGFTALHLSFNRLLRAMSREITKRKEAEILLACMLDSIPDLIYYKGRSGAYLGCNKAFADLTGYGQADIIGHLDSEIFQPGLASFFTVHDQESIDQQRSYSDERWLELEDSLLFMHTYKIPYNGPDNSLLGVIGISRDLTVYKEATEGLEQAALEWSAAMDADKDAVYILDLDRNLLRANKAFYVVMETDAKTALGRPIEKIVHPPFGEHIFCPIGQALDKLQDGHFVREADHVDNLSGVPLEFTVTIIRDSMRKPISIFVRRHDLSAQRAVEDSLRKSKEEWEQTFDSIADLITIQDPEMRIVRANKAAENFFQEKQGGLTGRYCYNVFRGQDSPCQDCPLLRVSEKTGEHPPIIRHDNLKKLFNITSSSVLGPDGKLKYLIHIARDITAQKELEEERFQAHKMEGLGTMAGGIAHDFNNILAAIIGFSEFVRDDLATDSPSREDIAQVLKAAERAKDLVQQILSFSRKSDHQLQIVEPYYIVQEVLKMMHATLPSTVTIEEELDKNAGKIFADPAQIHQILVNLCTNGFQAMKDEKGVLRITLKNQEIIENSFTNEDVWPGSYVVLQVSDTGQGMDEETRERIFDPFFTTKEVGKGTGLGLAVIHGIVKDYKGFVDVKSSVGAGSTFRVYLPVIEAIESDLTLEQKATEKKTFGGSEVILVVDDDPLLVRLNGRILSNLGYHVTEKVSSLEALETVRSKPQKFDLLITDQTMPHLTGIELAAEVMKISPDIAVIMCTGYSSVVSANDALGIGIHRYVFKPVQTKKLVKAVREVLDEREGEDPLIVQQ